MASRGKAETVLLRENIDNQLNRLMLQLEDIEELKDEFDSKEEYEQTKEETLAQLREFQSFLEKSISGDLNLMDAFGSAQLAIQAAISQAFKTPEVIRMFANKQDDGLRRRLEIIRRDYKLKVIPKDAFNRQAAEILVALKKMGAALTAEDQAFLAKLSHTRHLEDAVDSLGSGTQSDLMAQASSQIKESETLAKSPSGSRKSRPMQVKPS
eukprot:gb/GEZN01016174.1/.p1 GENE.gb/GEZN01016174.1/~~gb/GEZN01016174.1/.p1  ORF type:complete len:211 (+),score=40.49 gb/GEZN01016174.1/:82-714(+)